jgi:hypothetical protein
LNSPSNELIGSFNSTQEVSFNVSIKLDTNITGLVDLIPEKSLLYFVNLQTFPLLFHFSSTNLRFRLVYNGTQNYVFPTKYRENFNSIVMYLVGDPTIQQRTCTLSVNQSVCGDYIIPATADGIRLFYPRIYLNFTYELYNAKKPTVGYQTATIIQFGPYLSLNRNYQITILFDGFVLKNYSVQVDFYCKVSGSTVEYPGTVYEAPGGKSLPETNKLTCIIPYFGLNQFSLNVSMRVPSISSESVLLNQNSITGYFAGIYFLI